MKYKKEFVAFSGVFLSFFKCKILLQSEIPSGMCAKLRTAAASNNRDNASQSLLLLLAHATYIMVLFFTHILFVVNHTINTTLPERLQQYHICSSEHKRNLKVAEHVHLCPRTFYQISRRNNKNKKVMTT